METWVIFKVWLLINFLVNVAETFMDALKHYFRQMNNVKFCEVYAVKNYLKASIFWVDVQTRHTARQV